MKNSIALLLLALLAQNNVAGQPHGWYWQSPLPQGNNLYDICSDPTHAGRYIAVGDHGTILVKDDRYTWYQMESGTKENLYAVCFSQTNGWVVGYNGTILHNTDGQGVVWTKQTSGTTKMLLSVYFTDFLHGWAVGQNQTVLRTTDGGGTWNDITISGTQHYFAVFFADYLNGWIAGAAGYNGVVKKTTNGGSSWSNSLIPNKRMNSIKFVTDSVGCVVGDSGRVYTTANGGQIWSQGNSNTASDLKDLFLESSGEGWATGADGTILHTTDFGRNWTPRSSPTDNLLYNVEREFAVGWGGVIVQVEDMCTMQSSGFTEHMHGVDFGADALRGFAVGLNGHVYYTNDAGATWSAESCGTTRDLYAIDVVSGDVGWMPSAIIVGERGTVLVGTHDYWHNRSISTTDKLYAVHRFFGGDAWVAGEWGRIWHTTDHGEHWSLQHENTSYHLHTIHFVSRKYGWAAGMNGKVLKTTNGGADWIDVSPNSPNIFGSIYFLDSQRGWVVGTNGTILRTSDGGTTWVSPPTQVTPQRLNAVRFINENIGWVAGAAGSILHTTDGGDTWTSQNSGCIGELRSMSFPDIGVGWICGFDGLLLHTEDGGGALTYRAYLRESLNLHVPDPGEVSDTIDISIFPKVSSAVILSGITVMIDSLMHPNVSDLALLLTHEGITDTLAAQGDLSGSNVSKCTFADGSSASIEEGEAPYADAYRPHSPLSVFHGMSPYGEWRLRVLDMVSGNAGTLHAWGLKLSTGSVTGLIDGPVEVSSGFNLYQNYPNPFNPSTTIGYSLPRTGHVRLSLFNILGQEVCVLVDRIEAAGDHGVRLDAGGLSTGVYFYRMQVGEYSAARRLLLVR